jgi:ABC-2 type transport system ATP-binding protein
MNALEIQGLTKRYPSFYLDHISFSLPQGAVMGLIGENGAGKTTIMKSILKMIRETEGEIFIFGKKIGNTVADLKEEIGIVMDDGNFPDFFNVKDVNRMMKLTYRNWSEKRFWELTERFSLPTDKKIKELSRGNKMKVLLFTAMSHDPKLLILDEATSGLDPVARDGLLDLFNDFTREEDHSILISSHIVSDLEKICDYITFIHQGKLLFTQEKDLLKETYGMLHLGEEELSSIPREAICGIKRNGYGADVLAERAKLPQGMKTECPGIEEIMLFLTKEAVR